MGKKKDELWSISTTVRSANRVMDFLRALAEMDGKPWTHDAQVEYQIRLIANRFYTPTDKGLSKRQCALLREIAEPISFEDAERIFWAKDYEDPAMRGRQSANPLKKLGLVRYASNEPIRITQAGHDLLDGKADFGDVLLEALLKFQYPNPAPEESKPGWCVKPFIAILRLIKAVNARCAATGRKPKGLTFMEFGIFALSLRDIHEVEATAERVVSFRKRQETLPETERPAFIQQYIDTHLSDFNNPRKNVHEYADNVIRYLRLTRYFYIRGRYDHACIDLESRRMAEINAILATDTGEPRAFISQQEWDEYIGTAGAYPLPFETLPALTRIATQIREEIQTLAIGIGRKAELPDMPDTTPMLKKHIAMLRDMRNQWQTLKIRFDSQHDVSHIDAVLQAFDDLLAHRRQRTRLSVELERLANLALNILDDATAIRPNAPLGDDNEPTFTAPSGVPDIECIYTGFVATCEVTMLTGRDQWYNEGQPVMRHLRAFEDKHPETPGYCIFVAPALHTDALNTFRFAVRYEYEGRPQRIIPLTIRQFADLLKVAKTRILAGAPLRHDELRALLDACVDLSAVDNSKAWLDQIKRALDAWHSTKQGKPA